MVKHKSLGKETHCRGFLNYSTLRRSRFLLCFLLLLQSFLSLIFLTPLLKPRHFLFIIEKLGNDRLVHTHDLQDLVLGDLRTALIAADLAVDPDRVFVRLGFRKKVGSTKKKSLRSCYKVPSVKQAIGALFRIARTFLNKNANTLNLKF